MVVECCSSVQLHSRYTRLKSIPTFCDAVLILKNTVQMCNLQFTQKDLDCTKDSAIMLQTNAVLPESAKLPRERRAAGLREGVSNVELNLGWDQVLVAQKLQFPHPTSLRQLQGDVLGVAAQPAEYLIPTMLCCFQKQNNVKLHRINV